MGIMQREGQGGSTRFYLECKPRINDLRFGFCKGISLNPLFWFKILRPGGKSGSTATVPSPSTRGVTPARGGMGSERRGCRCSASNHTMVLVPGSRGARLRTGRLMGRVATRWAAGRAAREGKAGGRPDFGPLPNKN
jgi:hypothetical protein